MTTKILVRAHYVIDGKVMFPPKMLEKHSAEKDFGFNIFQEENWLQYLLKNYGALYDDEHKCEIAFTVMLMGSTKNILMQYGEKNIAKYMVINEHTGKSHVNTIINLFPGKTDKCEKRDLKKFGVMTNYV